MTMISIEDPILQGTFRKFAADTVAFLASVNALGQDDPRPEPGTQQELDMVNRKLDVRVVIVTEWRSNDLTRHVRFWELESGEPLLDIVYAEGGNEELEQALIDDLWLANLNLSRVAADLREIYDEAKRRQEAVTLRPPHC